METQEEEHFGSHEERWVKYRNRHFPEKDKWSLSTYNRGSTSLTRTETQIKPAQSYSSTPVRLGKHHQLHNTLGETLGKQALSVLAEHNAVSLVYMMA